MPRKKWSMEEKRYHVMIGREKMLICGIDGGAWLTKKRKFGLYVGVLS
jgi:hypothetical protein